MSKRLVTYFFASGVTAKVAENLADAIGADIFEIQLKVSYTKADLNWMDKKVRSTIEMSDPASRPAIAAKRDNIAEYDTIFVGYSSVKYKRRKEEAVKMQQLRNTYGNNVSYSLFLCGYFDSGYLGYEAAEGIDWIWEHRISDMEQLGI